MTTLDIAELSIELDAVTTHSRVDTLERFVAESVATRFADALAALEDAVAVADDAEIFIDHLVVDCNFSSSWDGAALARALATRVHHEIVRATRAGACLAFRDRAEFIAALILALADGRAGRHWWFDSFAGLALVPASNAVRTVVLDEGEAGIAALARLTASDAQRVIGGLARGDAVRILDRIASRATAVAPSARVLWERSRDLRSRHEDPNGWLLALVAAERDAKGSAAAPALAMLQSFRSLRATARSAPDRIAAAMAQASGLAMVDVLASCGVDANGLRTVDAHALADICRAVDGCADRDAGARVVHYTPHGGALLLRVVLDRTDWQTRWHACLSHFDAVTEDVIAWMIVTRAISPPDAPPVREDVALRLLLPDDSGARVEALAREPIGGMIDGAAEVLLNDFTQRLPGADGASADWLRHNVLSFAAHVTVEGGTVQASVDRPALDVMLVFGGWKRTSCTLASGRLLTLREAQS